MLQTIAPSLRIDSAHLCFGEQQIFTDFSLTLASGKTTVLLGQSGVGKSVLLKMLLNQHTWHNQPGISAYLRLGIYPQMHIEQAASYIAQSNTLLPWFSVLDNALLSHKLRHLYVNKPTKLRAQTLLSQLGLGNASTLYPHEISGGMQQRVIFARTLLQDRPILLLDEPFSALDTVTKLALYGLIETFFKDKTICWVTHDPLEAILMADDIFIMHGRPVKITQFDVGLDKQRDFKNEAVQHRYGALMQQLIACQEIQCT